VKVTEKELKDQHVAFVIIDTIKNKFEKVGISLGTDLKTWKPPVRRPNHPGLPY
jgi:hypothetical protein